MIILPYADDIRSNSDIMNKMIKVDESNNEESEIAKKLIKKMNISFDVEILKMYLYKNFILLYKL